MNAQAQLAGSRQSQTMAEMDRIRAAITHLGSQVDVLVDRLKPVLFDCPANVGQSDPLPPVQSLADHPHAIRQLREEIDRIAGRVTSALGQLEI